MRFKVGDRVRHRRYGGKAGVVIKDDNSYYLPYRVDLGDGYPVGGGHLANNEDLELIKEFIVLEILKQVDRL